MKEFLKKNSLLAIAFALPIILIVGIALFAYLPSLFVSTEYNFLYSVCDNGLSYYYYVGCSKDGKNFSVSEGKLIVMAENYSIVDGRVVIETQLANNVPVTDTTSTKVNARIFLHNTKENISREISFEEAKKLSLDGFLTSPDGVAVSSHYDNYNVNPLGIFGGRSEYNLYLTKGKSRSKLNLINPGDDYYYRRGGFQFIGWVISK